MSVEAVKAPPVPGVQKPPRWVGKRFRDSFVAALEKKKVKERATSADGCRRVSVQ
jgi:hypothetical protein